jgi:xanthosine utilization system XapX-like protein
MKDKFLALLVGLLGFLVGGVFAVLLWKILERSATK